MIRADDSEERRALEDVRMGTDRSERQVCSPASRQKPQLFGAERQAQVLDVFRALGHVVGGQIDAFGSPALRAGPRRSLERLDGAAALDRDFEWKTN